MKFVFALLVLAAVAYARPEEGDYFQETSDLGGIQRANIDIATAAANIMKKEEQLAGLIEAKDSIYAAETATEAAASVEDIQNSWVGVTTDDDTGGANDA